MTRFALSDRIRSALKAVLEPVIATRLHTCDLCTAVFLQATEERALKRYLDMEPLDAMNEVNEGKN